MLPSPQKAPRNLPRYLWLLKNPDKHTKAQLLIILKKLLWHNELKGPMVLMSVEDFKHLKEHCDCYRIGL